MSIAQTRKFFKLNNFQLKDCLTLDFSIQFNSGLYLTFKTQKHSYMQILKIFDFTNILNQALCLYYDSFRMCLLTSVFFASVLCFWRVHWMDLSLLSQHNGTFNIEVYISAVRCKVNQKFQTLIQFSLQLLLLNQKDFNVTHWIKSFRLFTWEGTGDSKEN